MLTNAINNFKDEITDLNSDEPNRVRGALWMTAGAVALVAPVILGGISFFLLSFNPPVFVSCCLAVAGFSLVIAGVPVGVFLANKFMKSGWHDLTHKKVTA
jgi:hypothetical protein